MGPYCVSYNGTAPRESCFTIQTKPLSIYLSVSVAFLCFDPGLFLIHKYHIFPRAYIRVRWIWDKQINRGFTPHQLIKKFSPQGWENAWQVCVPHKLLGKYRLESFRVHFAFWLVRVSRIYLHFRHLSICTYVRSFGHMLGVFRGVLSRGCGRMAEFEVKY